MNLEQFHNRKGEENPLEFNVDIPTVNINKKMEFIQIKLEVTGQGSTNPNIPNIYINIFLGGVEGYWRVCWF